ATMLFAQPVPEANYDEAKVPRYTLPDPLILADGQRVNDAATWREKRRPELLMLFEENVYGRSPGKPQQMRFEARPVARDALDGLAVRKEVTIRFAPGDKGPKIDMVL